MDQMRRRYRTRRDTLIEGFSSIGWDIPSPKATMFVWAPIPSLFKANGSMEFSKLLLKEAKVAVAPGVGFGEHGEGFVRIGLVENQHRIRQAIRNIKTLFNKSGINTLDTSNSIRAIAE